MRKNRRRWLSICLMDFLGKTKRNREETNDNDIQFSNFMKIMNSQFWKCNESQAEDIKQNTYKHIILKLQYTKGNIEVNQ